MRYFQIYFRRTTDPRDRRIASLQDYLLSKCVAFPRFFFLSNAASSDEAAFMSSLAGSCFCRPEA